MSQNNKPKPKAEQGPEEIYGPEAACADLVKRIKGLRVSDVFYTQDNLWIEFEDVCGVSFPIRAIEGMRFAKRREQ